MTRILIATRFVVAFVAGAVCSSVALAQAGGAAGTSSQDAVPPAGQQDPAQETAEDTVVDKASFLLGYNFVSEFKNQQIDINVEKMIAGMQAAAKGEGTGMTDEEIAGIEEAFQRMVMAQQQEMFREAAEKNQREGQAFLEANKQKEGVTEFESGLQVKVIEEGTGAIPTINDSVRVRYKGSFPDGEEFDASGEQPVEFPVRGVIPGMSEALQKMQVGSKWMVYIPGRLSYGQQGRPPVIGPNQTLVFELELVDIAN